MKKLFSIIFATVGALSVHAADWGALGQPVSTNISYAAIPHNVAVTHISAQVKASGDGQLKAYGWGSSITVTQDLAAGYSNIVCNLAGTSLVGGDVLLLYSVSLQKFQRVLVSSTNADSILITNELTSAVTDFALIGNSTSQAGQDRIYKMTLKDTEYLTDKTTVTKQGDPIYKSADGMPSLFEVKANGSATNIWLVVGGRQ